jgi:superinfection exclusion protein B
MIESITALLASLKQTSPAIFSGLAIACGIIIFGNSNFLETIGLLEFREENRSLMGGILVISLSILSSQLLVLMIQFAKSLIKKNQEQKKQKIRMAAMISGLENLTPDEKSYLSPFIFNQQASVNFLMEDGIKGSLVNKNILLQASNLGDMSSGWAYNLQPWAREHLKANTEFLDGASDAVQNRFPQLY